MLAFLHCNHVSHLPAAVCETPPQPCALLLGKCFGSQQRWARAPADAAPCSVAVPIPATEGLRGLRVP